MSTAIDLDWDVARSRARGCKRWAQYDESVVDLTVAEMDLPVADPVRAAVRDAVERQSFGYPLADERSGVPEEASSWLAGEYGFEVPPGRIRLLPELMRGITGAVTHLTRAGSAVVVPTPAYGRFFDAVALAGREVVQVPMRVDGGSYRLDLDRMDAALRAGAGSVLLCHPNNPTGRILTDQELRALSTVVERRGARVISDEIHAPLRYDGSFTPYAMVDDAAGQHTVTLFSATKAWNFPGLRCGLIAFGDAADVATWSRLPRAAVGGMSPLGMAATVAAFRDGRPWLDQVRRVLGGNRTLVADRLAAHGLGDVYTEPEASYLAWLDLRRTGLTDPSGHLLRRTGVATTPGPDHGEAGSGFVRLNFATPPSVLAAAVDRLAAALT